MSYLGFDQGDPSIIHAGDAVRKVKDATVMGNDNKGPVRGEGRLPENFHD